MLYAIKNQTVPRQFGLSSGTFLPARLDASLTAQVLGFQEHDIPVLVAAKMLKPLGKPVPNATKYFAACEIEAYAVDAKWLRDATQVIYDHWKEKNDKKTVNVSRIPPATAEVSLVA